MKQSTPRINTLTIRHGCVGRHGITTIEVVISLMLLGITAATVGRFAVHVRQTQEQARINGLARLELANAREVIGAMQFDMIQPERLASLPISKPATLDLANSRWHVEVDSVSEPIVAKRVRLQLQWLSMEQTRTTDALTFWVPAPLPSPALPNADPNRSQDSAKEALP